ncbi:hypothetical protein [Methanobacterium paludis]|uniref:Glycosyltransferase RgtA/B/C/D-like domain-containing protein n=1 Tax=Methanobacterium paludis (strain DSM 25820 / JCM 18151 / SWAN1) TaxID=868131 RepID=F6D2A9_METPW|nr:hypothetical protein [Methanobacterium paludis]AEG18626.1 hypothetical protein MSWAN_1615 [Methanobacterium paludis]
MRDYRSILKNNFDLILVLTLYSLLSVFFFSYYQYLINADGISYIGIAQKYVAGDWSNAINEYWGPLFSWLLIPFLLFNKTALYPLFSAKILSLIIGFFTIIGVERLSQNLGIERIFRVAVLFSLVPIVLYFAVASITPDLLVTCLLVYYLIVIFDPKYSNKLSNGIFCGIIGAAAYLTKTYALPFFCCSFCFFSLIYYFKSTSTDKKRNILKNFFLGIFIFFVISGVWIGTISDKYGHSTIGTSTEYNHALVGPTSQGHPMYYQGLLKPPNNSAVTVWEDPSNLKMEQWSPFESISYFKYQLNIIGKNVLLIINYIENFSLFSILIIIFSLVFIFKPSSEDSKNKLTCLLVTIILYCGGYTLILVEMRYIYLICILLLLMAFYLLNIAFKQNILNVKIRNILLMLLVISFIIPSTINLIQTANMGEGAYDLSQTLKADYGLQGNIASNGKWEYSLDTSYYLNDKYYGITKNTTNANDLQRELEDNNVSYYFVWDTNSDLQFSDYKKITNGNMAGLTIYSRINHLSN